MPYPRITFGPRFYLLNNKTLEDKKLDLFWETILHQIATDIFAYFTGHTNEAQTTSRHVTPVVINSTAETPLNQSPENREVFFKPSLLIESLIRHFMAPFRNNFFSLKDRSNDLNTKNLAESDISKRFRSFYKKNKKITALLENATHNKAVYRDIFIKALRDLGYLSEINDTSQATKDILCQKNKQSQVTKKVSNHQHDYPLLKPLILTIKDFHFIQHLLEYPRSKEKEKAIKRFFQTSFPIIQRSLTINQKKYLIFFFIYSKNLLQLKNLLQKTNSAEKNILLSPLIFEVILRASKKEYKKTNLKRHFVEDNRYVLLCPLMESIKAGAYNIVQTLLTNNAHANAPFQIEYFTRYTTHIMTQDYLYEGPPLMAALKHNKPEIARLLIQHGANPEERFNCSEQWASAWLKSYFKSNILPIEVNFKLKYLFSDTLRTAISTMDMIDLLHNDQAGRFFSKKKSIKPENFDRTNLQDNDYIVWFAKYIARFSKDQRKKLFTKINMENLNLKEMLDESNRLTSDLDFLTGLFKYHMYHDFDFISIISNLNHQDKCMIFFDVIDINSINHLNLSYKKRNKLSNIFCLTIAEIIIQSDLLLIHTLQEAFIPIENAKEPTERLLKIPLLFLAILLKNVEVISFLLDADLTTTYLVDTQHLRLYEKIFPDKGGQISYRGINNLSTYEQCEVNAVTFAKALNDQFWDIFSQAVTFSFERLQKSRCKNIEDRPYFNIRRFVSVNQNNESLLKISQTKQMQPYETQKEHCISPLDFAKELLNSSEHLTLYQASLQRFILKLDYKARISLFFDYLDIRTFKEIGLWKAFLQTIEECCEKEDWLVIHTLHVDFAKYKTQLLGIPFLFLAILLQQTNTIAFLLDENEQKPLPLDIENLLLLIPYLCNISQEEVDRIKTPITPEAFAKLLNKESLATFNEACKQSQKRLFVAKSSSPKQNPLIKGLQHYCPFFMISEIKFNQNTQENLRFETIVKNKFFDPQISSSESSQVMCLENNPSTFFTESHGSAYNESTIYDDKHEPYFWQDNLHFENQKGAVETYRISGLSFTSI